MAEPGAYACCGVRIDGYGPDSAVRALLQSQYGVARGVHLCNSYTLALAYRDDAYCRVLNTGDLNLADGHYVAMVGRWRGQADLTERVYGPTLMLSTMDRGREVGLRHFLYGTTKATLARLVTTLCELYPGLDIVGVQAPPFRRLSADEEDELAARIEAAKPDIVWVGVGTPRQDDFVVEQTARLRCTLVPVGAAFDFNSGTKRAAPRWVQRMGFEWLFRFAQEPRRLWRRYLIGIPVFMFGVLADLWRPRPDLAAHSTRRPRIPSQRLPAETALPIDDPPVALACDNP
jgi:N-acetylglucosaminyldiphosphoundecaprenol N-acetyl-beta-D-mannosaminyltransferase